MDLIKVEIFFIMVNSYSFSMHKQYDGHIHINTWQMCSENFLSKLGVLVLKLKSVS
jgi:hypothetical protein